MAVETIIYNLKITICVNLEIQFDNSYNVVLSSKMKWLKG